MSIRKLKKTIYSLLVQKDFDKGLEAIRSYPARQAVNPLFSFILSDDEQVKWRAVTAMGAVVADLAEREMESARVVMRRFLWNLNDESGGIGWGSPEAMGEIMARHDGLATEYAKMLVSYIKPGGNFIEHGLLQRGVLWGLGRLARARPRLVREAANFLPPYLASEDSALRGLAVWTAGAIGNESTVPLLERLLNDEAVVNIFIDGRLVACSVSRLAREALYAAGPHQVERKIS